MIQSQSTDLRRRYKKHTRGVLLAEALFATLLVASILSVLAGMISTWERASLKTKQRAGAILFARQQMERCLAAGFENLEDMETNGTPKILEVRRTLDGVSANSVYQMEIEVEVLPPGRVKSVEVITSYADDNGSPLRLFTTVYQTS